MQVYCQAFSNLCTNEKCAYSKRCDWANVTPVAALQTIRDANLIVMHQQFRKGLRSRVLFISDCQGGIDWANSYPNYRPK